MTISVFAALSRRREVAACSPQLQTDSRGKTLSHPIPSHLLFVSSRRRKRETCARTRACKEDERANLEGENAQHPCVLRIGASEDKQPWSARGRTRGTERKTLDSCRPTAQATDLRATTTTSPKRPFRIECAFAFASPTSHLTDAKTILVAAS